MGDEYKLTIDLNSINHLGINLYSSIPAVISEAVANSYDADAEKVDITIDPEAKKIIIQDNGCGMTKEECNNRYLTVGYKKREIEGSQTLKYKRHFMGRKGIGKLSLFSIAQNIEVHTVKLDKDEKNIIEKNGFVLNIEKIKQSIKENKKDCLLEPIKKDNITIDKGTRIILSQLNKNLSQTKPFLKKRIARRFSVIGEKNDFSVSIDGETISTKDRDYFGKIEYLWYFGDYGKECKQKCKNLQKSEEENNVLDKQNNYIIEGWIGTVGERSNLEEGNNTIIIQAWGKSIHDDILKNIDNSGIVSKYLIGEIRANFLDEDDEDDIATTDRQSVQEDDPRFIQLKQFTNDVLKKIRNKWQDWRKEDAEKKALENPKIKEWFDSLGKDSKKYARKLFEKIESFPISDEAYKKELYKHGILAFQTLAIKDNLSFLDQIDSKENFDMFLELLGDIDQLEALNYHEIVKGRIGILEKFIDITNEAKEKTLQQYVFEHLWLLDPSWERSDTVNKKMEESVTKEFNDINNKLKDEEKKARIDIRYRSSAGNHIIIELKKYDADVDIDDLTKQIRKYRNALKKCLDQHRPGESHNIEIICILGSKPKNATDKETRESLKSIDARYITYDQLIKDALNGYKDYLKKQEKINKIRELIDSL